MGAVKEQVKVYKSKKEDVKKPAAQSGNINLNNFL